MARASKEALAALRFLPRLIAPEEPTAGNPPRLTGHLKCFVRGAFSKDVTAFVLSTERRGTTTSLSAGIPKAASYAKSISFEPGSQK